jgi:hypothetical protein
MTALHHRRLALAALGACTLAACLFGCGGGSGGAEQGGAGAGSGGAGPGNAIDQPPPPRTEAVLAGPLCQGNACRCRKADGDAGPPPAGAKRFEVHLGPSDDPLWAMVDGMVLYKSRETPEACFYVDLAAGEHRASLRGKGESGLSAAIAVSEQGGSDGTWWFHTFQFQCGSPGECDMASIESWKREVAAMAGKHDPCGSTKVQDIHWETGRMPDRTHPDHLLLHFTLDVYKFAPSHPPGSDECDKGGPAAGK